MSTKHWTLYKVHCDHCKMITPQLDNTCYWLCQRCGNDNDFSIHRCSAGKWEDEDVTKFFEQFGKPWPQQIAGSYCHISLVSDGQRMLQPDAHAYSYPVWVDVLPIIANSDNVFVCIDSIGGKFGGTT